MGIESHIALSVAVKRPCNPDAVAPEFAVVGASPNCTYPAGFNHIMSHWNEEKA